jgi:hypothetical protein
MKTDIYFKKINYDIYRQDLYIILIEMLNLSFIIDFFLIKYKHVKLICLLQAAALKNKFENTGRLQYNQHNRIML